MIRSLSLALLLAAASIFWIPTAAKADSICHTPASTFNASLAAELGVCDANGNLQIKLATTSPGGAAANPSFSYLAPNTSNANGACVIGQGVTTVGCLYLLVGQEPGKYTYSASASVPAIAGVAYALCGSATKTVRVRHIGFTGNATTAGTMVLFFQQTSTAYTGGTSASLLPFAHQQSDPTATATAVGYTVGATGGGTPIGYYRQQPFFFPVAAASTQSVLDFGPDNDKAPVLSGTAQCIGIVLSGSVPAGGTTYAEFRWSEE